MCVWYAWGMFYCIWGIYGYVCVHWCTWVCRVCMVYGVYGAHGDTQAASPERSMVMGVRSVEGPEC